MPDFKDIRMMEPVRTVTATLVFNYSKETLKLDIVEVFQTRQEAIDTLMSCPDPCGSFIITANQHKDYFPDHDWAIYQVLY